MDEFADRVPAIEKTQFFEHSKDKRNLRYGEVIPVFSKSDKLYVEVYITMGSNELPQDLWEKLDAEVLKDIYGAKFVILNGPRYWVLNEIVGKEKTAEGKVVDFSGIQMTESGFAFKYLQWHSGRQAIQRECGKAFNNL